ncbi:S-layer homology domain-containing protein [Ructibacterium gallinarum]|uniref:S-layer homology domain-containing protein n=1 Tax=Ructibacterium gallinarum TaxID=2779355 RepID=A0A9D5R9L3_9FIRM|nr:S-layer homology domain-containing protein [Ructibacterium gallinarum]MBE5040629.1 S-layer homology domain-containing protein [Ructibacterium gallinarum]
MKKKIALLLAFLCSIQIAVVSDIGLAASTEITPQPDDSVRVLAYEDFENGDLSTWTCWDAAGRVPEIQEGSNGSQVLFPNADYVYYQEGTSWKDYTLEFNWYVESYSAKWPGIYFQIENGKKNNLYFSDGQALVLETRDGRVYDASEDFTDDEGEWVYFRLEHYGNRVKIFYNNKTKPLLDIEDETFNGSGYFGFVSSGAGVRIDNLLVSKPLREVPVPVFDSAVSELIYSNDFEDGNTEGWSGGSSAPIITEPGVDHNEDNHVYAVTAYDSCQSQLLQNLRNYTIEFNMKIEYRDAEGAWGNTWPGLYFRSADAKRYNLYFCTIPGAESITVERNKNGQSTGWMGNADATGFTDESGYWAYFKIEAYGNEIKIYYMDKENPALIFTDTDPEAPVGGELIFNYGGASMYYLDNLLITSKKADPAVSDPVQPDPEKELLLFQDYENGEALGWTAGGNVQIIGGNHVFAIDQPVYTEKEYADDFRMDFNLWVDYRDSAGNFAAACPKISFCANDSEAYYLQMNTRLSNGGNELALIKKTAEGDEWLAWPVVWVMDDNCSWVHMRIQKKGNEILVYYKDMETPIIQAVDHGTPCPGGKVGFDGENVRSFYVDNFCINTFLPSYLANIEDMQLQQKEGQISCMAQIVNLNEEPMDAIAVLAAYRGGRLAGLTAQEVNLKSNAPNGSTPEPDEVTLALTGNLTDYEQVQLYLWKNLDTLQVLCPPKERQNRSPVPEPISEHGLTVQAECLQEEVSISGTLTSGQEREISVLVLKPGINPENLKVSQMNLQNVAELRQIPVDEDDSFHFDFMMNETEAEGRYVVLAGNEYPITEEKTEFDFISTKKMDEFLQKINLASEPKALLAALTSEKYTAAAVKLNLYPDLFAKLQTAGKNAAGTLMLDEKPEAGFSESNLSGLAVRALAVGMVKDCVSKQDVKSVFGDRKDFYTFSSADWEAYAQAAGTLQEEICDGIYHNKGYYQTPEDIAADFTVQIALAKIFLANYTEIQKLLEENEELLGVDSQKVLKLGSSSQKNKVYTGLNQQRCFDAETFAKLYQQLLSQSGAIVTGGTGTSGGGGGGSFGGSRLSGGGAVVSKENGEGTSENLLPLKEAKFSDVTAQHWAYTAITELGKKGIIQGFEDGTFQPDATVSRAEFVKMLILALDMDVTDGESPFEDVASEEWYAPYIISAAKQGLVYGVSQNQFEPDSSITREDMAVILYRAVQNTQIALPAISDTVFSDGDEISTYALEAVKFMADAGIICGSENRFYPKDSALRSETAQMLYRILQADGRKQ